VVGETGGKNFIVVHKTGDIENAVNNIIRAAFEYAGESDEGRSHVTDRDQAKNVRLCPACMSLVRLGRQDYKLVYWKK
jgi:acyl-CoA reductase-like NAD-dependent aldehyde dehydrogenase